MTTTTNDHNAVTLWNAWGSADGRTVRYEIGYTPAELDLPTFARVYDPVVTVTGVDDLADAYHHLQGETVNAEQHARNMVPSASVGDVLQVHHRDGTSSYHVVAPIGYSEVHFGGSA